MSPAFRPSLAKMLPFSTCIHLKPAGLVAVGTGSDSALSAHLRVQVQPMENVITIKMVKRLFINFPDAKSNKTRATPLRRIGALIQRLSRCPCLQKSADVHLCC